MNRRSFLVGGAYLGTRAAQPQPSLAITVDDVNWTWFPKPLQANAGFLDTLSGRHLQAALFVVGRNAEGETGQAIVRSWRDAGHLIGNHTYSHQNYDGLTLEEFSADTARAGKLLENDLGIPRLFRFPALKEGDTAVKRDGMRAFLSANGYRNGHVTIDASDWYYDSRLRARLASNPSFDPTPFRQPYLDHLWDRAQFYDGLSRNLLGRSVPHTLLVHYNLLNSLFLDDVLAMFAQRGWRLIDAQQAYRDPVFLRVPRTLPAGESLIWALARETGRFDSSLRYPAETGSYEKPKLDRLGL